jgi:hypothetical protein
MLIISKNMLKRLTSTCRQWRTESVTEPEISVSYFSRMFTNILRFRTCLLVTRSVGL